MLHSLLVYFVSNALTARLFRWLFSLPGLRHICAKESLRFLDKTGIFFVVFTVVESSICFNPSSGKQYCREFRSLGGTAKYSLHRRLAGLFPNGGE